jgi:hypothetical protein
MYTILIFAEDMDMKLLKNISLYFSAFVPMYFLIIIKFICGIASGMINLDGLTIFTICSYSLLIIAGVLGLLWNIVWNKDKSEEITIISKQNLTDQHFLGYFSIFVLFALAFELTKLSMVVDSLFIIIFIGIVYINNKMFYINPLLNLIGFNFYVIKYKKGGEDESFSAKIFCRGDLILNKPYKVKLENVNFSFIDK